MAPTRRDLGPGLLTASGVTADMPKKSLFSIDGSKQFVMFHHMNDTTVEPPVDQTIPLIPTAPERQENDYIGHAMTPSGWREVRWLGGKETHVDPLDAVAGHPIVPLHKKFRDKHRQALMAFMECVNQVQDADRKMPILREEMIEKVKFEKQIIKDLIGFGLIEQHVIPVSIGNKKMGGRAVLIPSLEARKLHRSVEEAMKDVVESIRKAQESESAQTPGDDVVQQAAT